MKVLFLFLCLILSTTTLAKVNHEVLFKKSDVIWGFDFLPDKKIIYTERGGKLFVYDPKTKKDIEVTGAPEVNAVGQGGLLDVRVHPKSRDIYLTYSAKVKDKATTALGVGKLKDNKLTNFKKIFEANSPSGNDEHYGSRIEFKKDHVYVTVGDRGERDKVQSLAYHIGKTVRLNLDGSPASGNPFADKKNAKPEIWTSGHRSPQGLTLHPETKELWMAEMGPKGGDEINILKAGGNYGWPEVSYGREYHGPKIGGDRDHKGFVEPFVYWTPSISPSAMTFWKGDVYLGNLSGQHIRKVSFKDKKITGQEELLKDLGWRFRNLRPGPDGLLYFSTDEGRLGRITN